MFASLNRVSGPRISLDYLPGLDHPGFTYYTRLRRLKDYVEQHLQEPISTVDAAGVAALEVKYFSRFFRARIGLTFKEWLSTLRVEIAAQMMMRQDHSVTEVTYLVGFGSLRTFERAFKRRKHVTPREFKDRTRPEEISSVERKTIPRDSPHLLSHF